jgi:cold shock CspA family protein
LQDYVRRRQPQAMKTHIGPAHGQIVRLLPDRDCGFLATADGQEIYFHRNSVADLAFDKLEIGSEVRFVETMGEQGPQASTVALVGRLGKHAF